MEYEKNKCLYRDDGSIWFDEWDFVRPVFFTGNVNDYYAYGKVERMKKNNLHFLEKLHSKVFRKNRKEITRLVVVERGMKITNFIFTQYWKLPNIYPKTHLRDS